MGRKARFSTHRAAPHRIFRQLIVRMTPKRRKEGRGLRIIAIGSTCARGDTSYDCLSVVLDAVAT